LTAKRTPSQTPHPQTRSPDPGPRLSGPYFFADPAAISEDSIALDAFDARHLGVRRIRPGDVISVGDGAGRIFEARVEAIDADHAEAAILATFQEPAPRPRITVLQGLAKGSKVDWAVEKMVELGVDRIVVFASGRSVPVWDRSKAEAAARRWDRVARAAAKQSRRAWLPTVEGPLSSREAVELAGKLPLVLVADPAGEHRLRDSLPSESPEEIALVVGPESGLAPDEIEALREVGATTVDLGPQILRTETAGLALAAAVMFQCGRLG
jgi:16S rRNA (uracil1498-N3)-methyltransferase